MPKYDAPFFVIDVETGGLPSVLKKKATLEVALTELAVVVVDNVDLKIIDKISWLIKPFYTEGLIYEPKALEVSNISLKLLNDEGTDIDQAFSELKTFIKKHKSGRNKPYLCGHNLDKFDLEFISNLFLLNKEDIYDYFDESTLDTLKLARLKYIENSSFNLGSVSEKCGFTLVQSHRALADTEITAKILISFMTCLRGESVTEKVRFRESFTFEY